MITACKIAGYFAAHAIWSVSDSPILIPILAYITKSDERKMERFVGEDTAACVAQAKQWIVPAEHKASIARELLYLNVPPDQCFS